MELRELFRHLVRRVAAASKASDRFAGAIKTSEKATTQHQNSITEQDRLGNARHEQASHTEMSPRQPSPIDDANPARELPLLKMLPKYRGESVEEGGTVRYLTAAERMELKLTVRDGELYNRHGELFHTKGCKPSGAIWVIDREGRFYASIYNEPDRFHHSSLVAGQPVVGAGTFLVAKGQIQAFTSSSGHYLPNRR